MVNILLSLLVTLMTIQGQGTAAAPASAPQKPTNPIYLVGPNDVLGIKVFDEPTLSGDFPVDADGTITFPFLRRVPVQGKTLHEIEAVLTTGLRGDYVRNPQVAVEITKFRSRSIFLIGEVRAPGKYTMEGPSTLLELIARAGSFTPTAGPEMIVQRYKDGMAAALASAPAQPGSDQTAEVMRINIEDLKQGRFQGNMLLQDSDTIYVPAADKFYVTGFVKTPGAFPLSPGMTVRQAIAIAGGLTERGSTRGIKIIRKVNNKEVEIDVNMADFVQPNDTIKVRQRLI
jgi:polysaccharide export outer membrane protein